MKARLMDPSAGDLDLDTLHIATKFMMDYDFTGEADREDIAPGKELAGEVLQMLEKQEGQFHAGHLRVMEFALDFFATAMGTTDQLPNAAAREEILARVAESREIVQNGLLALGESEQKPE